MRSTRNISEIANVLNDPGKPQLLLEIGTAEVNLKAGSSGRNGWHQKTAHGHLPPDAGLIA